MEHVTFLTAALATDPSGLRRVTALREPLRRRGVESSAFAVRWPWLDATRARADAGDLGAARRLRWINRARLLPRLRTLRDAATLRRVEAAVRRSALVVIHRAAPPRTWADAVRRSGRDTVFDVDDALWIDDEEGFSALCGAARAVTCGSRILCDEVLRRGARRAVHIPTASPSRRHLMEGRRPDTRGEFRLLWLGSPTTLVYLGDIAAPLRRLAAERAVRLIVVGSGGAPLPPLDGVLLDLRPSLPYDPADHLADADVGLLPLRDGPWERGKCAAKAVDYLSAGLPCVASAAGANGEVVEDGVSGFLAEDPDRWYDLLHRLAADASLRERMAAAAVERHREAFDLDAAADRWARLVREGA